MNRNLSKNVFISASIKISFFPYHRDMKLSRLLLFFALCSGAGVFGQNYQITHLFITQNSSPTSINGKIEIADSNFTITYYGTDTTVEKRKITSISETSYYLDNNSVYIFSTASDKKERKAGVMYIELTTTQKIKDPKRKSMLLRVVTQ